MAWLPPVLAWGLSLVTAFALVASVRWHGGATLDGQVIAGPGSRKLHDRPAPRIGGLAVALGLWGAWCWAWAWGWGSGRLNEQPSTASWSALLGPMLACGLPAFVAGLAEDCSRGVSVRMRLLATVGSGLLAAALGGVVLNRTGFWAIDGLLAWAPLAWVLTGVALGGLANAINIIDGSHGLAAGSTLVGFVAFGVMALLFGDAPLALLCATLSAATAGFLLFNWPWGRLFLGDGGAYLLGFTLGWVALLLIGRHPAISPMAVLLVCLHPVTEVLFSILRRQARRVSPADRDNLHLHSLLMRRLSSQRLSSAAANAATGLLLPLTLTTPAAIWAVFSRSHQGWASAGCVLLVTSYLLLYRSVARLGVRSAGH